MSGVSCPSATLHWEGRHAASSSAYPLLLFDYFFLHFVRSTLLVRRLPVFICCRLLVWKRNFLLYQSHDDSLSISSPALFSIFIHELLLSGIQLRSLQKPFKNLRLFLHACILRSKSQTKTFNVKRPLEKFLREQSEPGYPGGQTHSPGAAHRPLLRHGGSQVAGTSRRCGDDR